MTPELLHWILSLMSFGNFIYFDNPDLPESFPPRKIANPDHNRSSFLHPLISVQLLPDCTHPLAFIVLMNQFTKRLISSRTQRGPKPTYKLCFRPMQQLCVMTGEIVHVLTQSSTKDIRQSPARTT